MNQDNNLTSRLEKNGVFFKWIRSIDVDKDNNLYFLDSKYCEVFRIDFHKAKLLNTIASRGQGPGEIWDPIHLIVKNEKVFIADRGFNGLKIFTLQGAIIREFRINNRLSCFDVNHKDEIFIKETDSDSNSLIALYDIKGEKLGVLFNITPKTDSSYKNTLINTHFSSFKLDGEGNIVVLFQVDEIVKKYTHAGHLLWEKKIKNELLDKVKAKSEITINDKQISFTMTVTQLDVSLDGLIYIGHLGGGCIYNTYGGLKAIIEIISLPENENKYLSHFKVFNNYIVSYFVPGKYVNLIRIVEGRKP